MRDELHTKLARFQNDEARIIETACAWAWELHQGKQRLSGENTAEHSERVALILADMGMDADSLAAALLHQAFEDGLTETAAIKDRFGNHIALLTEGVGKMAALKAKNKTIQAAETTRKMLFALASDLRVIIIKLADKLDNMRTLKWLPETDRRRIASECIDIFAPLADRLGISWMKDELEDLALKEINREAFNQIKALVADKKKERENFLREVQDEVMCAARDANMQIQIMSRAKHFYSIYRKMRKKGATSDELYDLSGIRIICADESDCYELLGLIHRLWKPIDGRFKDYIAIPKANGYQSLHTSVMTPGGKLLEVQIRTAQMHSVAEFGVASHWLYKKGSTSEIIRPEDLSIVNRLKDWSEILASSGGEFLEEIKQEILKDSIIVFTPKGDPIELPCGSTPIDFAYAIHSDIGAHCIAAKTDGHIISLDSELGNTQIVEIQTSQHAVPHVHWLESVKTSKARSKIRAWLAAEGVLPAADERKPDEKNSDKKKFARPAASRIPQEKPARDAGLSIQGADKILIRFAACCKPRIGDEIVGYISRGRGLIVHKVSCKNIAAIPDIAERRMELSWESADGFVRRYHVIGRKDSDFFAGIENVLRQNRAMLTEVRFDEDAACASGSFTVSYADDEAARKSERRIRQLPSVLKLKRLR